VLVVRMLGLGIALVLVGLGALGVVSQFFRQRADEATTFAGEVLQVVAQTDIGDVSVRQGALGQPLVVRRVLTWSFDRPTADVVRNGTRVDVTGRCGNASMSYGECSVDLDIILPVGASVIVRTRTGDISADGVGGVLEASTSTGDVDLRGLRSPRVTATSSAGDVRVALLIAPQSVRARTATGDVQVRVPADGTTYQVNAQTSVGDQTVRLPDDPASERTISASSSVGDVTVTAVP
jgi:hypothetical protein